MDAKTSYTRTAIWLHWIIALLIFFGWSIGLRVSDLPPSPDKLKWLNVHKWIGITVLMLVVVRIAWRATHTAPDVPATTPAWQRTAARVAHAMLYLLMLAVPLTGWTMSSAKGYQTVWLGLVPLPDLLHKNEPLGHLLDDIHVTLAWTLACVVGVHLAAAMKHHFMDKDGVLRRMVPMLAVVLLVAAATPGRVDAAKSEISATFRQMNVPVEAPFRSFSGEILFDPTRPEEARARLEVATASFDIGSEEYNDEVRKKEWFDTAAYPKATFVSSKVSWIGPNRYTASGTLTFKGRSAPLDLSFVARSDATGNWYEGEFPLSRKAWVVGAPDWDRVLEDQVVVKFRLLATRK